MIIEIRKYTLKPGKRDDFIAFFSSTNGPALRDAGMKVSLPMRDTEDENVVHWMRGFETAAQRDAIKDAFYAGPVWLNKIEPVVMPMIESYEASIVETSADFFALL